MEFRITLSLDELDGLCTLADRAARFPTDHLRQLLRRELENAGLLVDTDGEPEERREKEP